MQGDSGAPTVVLVHGSTGAGGVEPWAALWASHGHRAVVVAYMDEPGLPTAMREIAVEALDDALREASRLADGAALVVISFSVGTIGALSALAQLSTVPVSAVVAVAPSHAVQQALGENGPPPKASSWSLRGEPLPWVPIRGERLLPEIVGHAVKRRFSRHPQVTALHIRRAFEAGLTDEAAVAAATIPVERIAAPLLVISGDDDAIQPGTEMAAALLRRRRDAGLVGDDQLALPHAGHFQRPPIIPTTVTWNDSLVSGGTPESDVVGDAGLPVTTIDTPLGEITYLPSLIEMPDIKPGYVRGPQLWAPPC